MVVSLSALMTSVSSHLCDLMFSQQAAKPHVKSQALDCIDAARKLVSHINPYSAKRRRSVDHCSHDDSYHAVKKAKVDASSESNLASGVIDQQSSAHCQPPTEKRNLSPMQALSDAPGCHLGVPVVNKPGFIQDARQKLSDVLPSQNARVSHVESYSASLNKAVGNKAAVPDTMATQVLSQSSRGKSEAYINNKARQFQQTVSASTQTSTKSQADRSVQTGENQKPMETAQSEKVPSSSSASQVSYDREDSHTCSRDASRQDSSQAFHGSNSEKRADEHIVSTEAGSSSVYASEPLNSRVEMSRSQLTHPDQNVSGSKRVTSQNVPPHPSPVSNTQLGHQSPMECDVGSLFSFLNDETHQPSAKPHSLGETNTSNLADGGYCENWGDSSSALQKQADGADSRVHLEAEEHVPKTQRINKSSLPAPSTPQPQSTSASSLQHSSAAPGVVPNPVSARQPSHDTSDVSYQPGHPACVSQNYHQSTTTSSHLVSHHLHKSDAIAQVETVKGSEYSAMLKKKIRSQVVERQANNEKKMGSGEGDRSLPDPSGSVTQDSGFNPGGHLHPQDVIDVETYQSKDPRMSNIQQHYALPYYNAQSMQRNGSLFCSELDNRRNLFERMRPVVLRKEMREFDTAKDVRRHLTFDSPEFQSHNSEAGQALSTSPGLSEKSLKLDRQSSKQTERDDISSHSLSPAATPICDEQFDESDFSSQPVAQYTCTACKYNGSNENYTFMTEAGLQQHTLTTHRISTCDVMV